MNTLFSYIQEFFRNVDKWLLLFCAGFTALLITLNYRFGIETKWLYGINSKWGRFAGFYCVYAIAFVIPWLVLLLTKHRELPAQKSFWVLLLVAPAIFALKVSFSGLTQVIENMVGGAWGRYYAIIANLPSRLILVLVPLVLFRWLNGSNDSFWGVTSRNFQWQPYMLMLMMMIPLVAFASTQADFLNTYPKMKQVAFINSETNHAWWYKFLYELSYGIDFSTIEIFFRGFLVFAFVRYAGPDAILPMAVFYCSIHFGKPLFESISSFFGGMVLGIISYRTQSILGGFVVHVGIAWLMEAGGCMGRNLKM